MHVVATAGHVDHGKSTLIRALTGMEPDRWAEERRRGMTIDLGYAWTDLAPGVEVAFVDVPGHQRFIGNMLAGLGPAPAVLFVVAADEGWSRQSEEHLAAVHALRLRHGLLAVTRSDLADPQPALRQAQARIARSSLGQLPAVAVSGVTGEGVEELRTELARVASTLPPPDTTGRIRLWIDRSFTVRGSGTVVTGTLGAGRLRAGDVLDLGGRRVTVRALQALGTARDAVAAVARVAVNLRGVAQDEVARGDALLTPGAWLHTDVVDVRLERSSVSGDESFGAEALPDGLILHVGTAALPVRLRALGESVARLTLAEPLPLRVGDRAILRDPGRQSVAAGALILDPDPPPLRRRGSAAARAAALQDADGRPDLPGEVRRRGLVRADRLSAIGVPVAELPADVRSVAGWLVSAPVWQRWRQETSVQLDRWAAAHPLDPDMSAEALRRALDLPDRELLERLLAEVGLVNTDGRVGRQRPAQLPGETGLVQIEQQLTQAPFAAPDRETLTALGLGRKELAAAERAGRLLRLAEDVVVLPSAPAVAIGVLRALPQPFTVSDARQALQTSRRVAVPLLEYLDRKRLTQRDADQRRRVIAQP
jgi:selenocysteine-specific elongation factor